MRITLPGRCPRLAGVPRALARALGLLLAAAAAQPAIAAADSLSLSISPDPTASIASQISWSASSEGPTLVVIAANNPGVPCASEPSGDTGQTITPQHVLEGGHLGQFQGSIDYTPPAPGAFTLCGWLETPAGFLETDGGPVTAAASLPIQVRSPRISLSLRTLGRPQPGSRFTLQLTATTEAARRLVVEGLPLTRRRCPVNYAAEELVHIIDRVLDGGPWLIRANMMPLRAGDYIFCAWADASGDEGLYPEARASLALRLGAATRAHRPRGRRGLARS